LTPEVTKIHCFSALAMTVDAGSDKNTLLQRNHRNRTKIINDKNTLLQLPPPQSLFPGKFVGGDI
jgi:hypothetical protein